MPLFISVINHNHDDIICNNHTLKKLAQEHTVILKSNTKASVNLKEYCTSSNIHLLQGGKMKGFGANNNEVFHYAKKELKMSDNDYFLVLNPDVEVPLPTINHLLKRLILDGCEISTINLFRNREMSEFDNSIRHFPNILNPIKSLLNLQRKDQYDKSKIMSPKNVDWAAGSFLLFKSEVFIHLQGFDERYFMYFEDVDLCKRAHKAGFNVIYYPKFKAIHYAQHSNRRLLSKESLYYIRSTLRYFLSDILD